MLVSELAKTERYEAFASEREIGEEIMAVTTYGVTQYNGVRESINEASLCKGGAEVLASYSDLNRRVQVSFTVKQSQGYAPMAKLTAFVSVSELDEMIEALTLAKVDAVRADHAPEPCPEHDGYAVGDNPTGNVQRCTKCGVHYSDVPQYAPEPSIDEHPEDAPEAPPHEER